MSQAIADEGVTGRLVSFALELQFDDVHAEVQRHCLRAFVNALGCVFGGSRHDLVERADRALGRFGGAPQATLLGRGRKTDALTAALLNGVAGAAYSFDDNYSAAMLHPSGPVASALLAYAETAPVSGADFLSAYAVGLEAACRLTNMLAEPPAETELGWSQTGIVCGVASALAVGRLSKCDAERLAWAVGIAASQAAGTRAAHGSMAASLIFGHAARCGLQAALLAAEGFSGAPAPIESRFGFAALYAKRANAAAAVADIGARFELMNISFKPFPCGLVIHPSLDGMLRLRAAHGFTGGDIERIRLRVSPSAMKFANHPAPANDIEAKVSLQHWVAIAAETGRAGIGEGGAEAVARDTVRAIRERIALIEDASLAADAAHLRVELGDGAVHELTIDHCVGSPDRPMSEAEVHAKFIDQAAPAIGQAKAEALAALCWRLASIDDMKRVAVLAT